MRFIPLRFLPILVLSGLLTSAQAATVVAAQPPANPPITYPQIVRLSYVEGDVRISRGKEGEKADEQESGETTGWEQAVSGLPIETGYSLVTGKGRAEIEFEDVSTVYLADNSVLSFNDLSATGGVPLTVMSLLSGTASLNAQTMALGEWFIMNTPTDSISLRYPQKGFVRVNSYLDSIAITPQRNMSFLEGGSSAPRTDAVGKTMSFSHGRRSLAGADTPAEAAASAEWDKWVAARVDAEEAATTAVMKEAGLASPVPGLAEMKGQGTFFACAPYGTCWEPTNGWDGQGAGAARMERVDAQAGSISEDDDQVAPIGAAVQTAGSPQTTATQKVKKVASSSPVLLTTYDDFFPCSPWGVSYLWGFDPLLHRPRFIRSAFDPFGWNYLWTVCHTGSWIHREHRYVWVAGVKRHHRCPVRWVKNGHSTGYVPIHPHDVAGKPPLNLKHGIFMPKDAKAGLVERAEFDAGKPVKVLDQAPKEFRKAEVEPLHTAAVPHAEGHSAFNRVLAAQGFTMKAQATPITFDRKSQSFMVARQTMEGGHPSTVVEPLGGRVNFQARGGEGGSMMRTANSGGGEYRGNTNSAGASRAPSSGGGSNGGGGGGSFHGGEAHGGGGGGGGFSGGGGGGGGAHSGGGGGGGASGGGGGGGASGGGGGGGASGGGGGGGASGGGGGGHK